MARPPLREVLLAVRDRVRVAWPDAAVSLGWPRTRTAPPYAVVALQPCERDWGAGLSVESVVEVAVIGRFALPGPSADPVELAKADRIGSAVEALQGIQPFAGVGVLPIVRSADPREAEDLEEDAFQVGLVFRCVTEEQWA